ncbi:hypothetical protein Ac2012v2_006312 [Leucoagaricus gongylophorus]
MDQRAATPSHHHISSYIFDVRQANSPGCSPYHQYMSIPLDNDDNGETAAGNRLALLLTGQYFGGFYLGADRFKHINQATRLNLHQDAESCPETASETSGILLGLASYEFRVSIELISFVNLTIFTYLPTDCIYITQKYETNLHDASVRMISTGDIIQIGLRRRFYSNLCTS